jgi:hypothetical protein
MAALSLTIWLAACNLAGTYENSSGHEVKDPRCLGAGSEGAHYKCRDGSFSFSEHRRGACSSHGGVAEDLTGGNE